MRTVVLGANGQDGSYLCERLLRLEHEVIGIGRDKKSRYIVDNSRFQYYSLNVEDGARLTELLTSVRPDHCYHFAALHGATGAGFTYEANWAEMVGVNLLSLHTVLEVARTILPEMRITYAGSCKIFPTPWRGAIDEDSPVRANCLYSIGKIAARDLMAQYRLHHGILATNLIFFNHDSPRRSPEYLLGKVACAIAAAKRGDSGETTLRSLDFWIDWGSAEEFMEIVAELGAAAFVPELVVASGTTVLAREVVNDAFERHGLQVEQHVVEEHPRSNPGPPFNVQLTRLDSVCRRPKIPVSQVIDAMVDSYSKSVQKPRQAF